MIKNVKRAGVVRASWFKAYVKGTAFVPQTMDILAMTTLAAVIRDRPTTWEEFGSARLSDEQLRASDLPVEKWNPVVGGDKEPQDDAGTTLFCGAYRFARVDAHPILSRLPPVIHIASARARGDHALQSIVSLLMSEAGRPTHGSRTVITRLMDVAFVYIVRSWLAEQPERAVGWLGALRDPQVGAALSAIHDRPGAPWTVTGLAKEVSMSRAPFAKRFSALVGVTPHTYLTRWRMDLAARLLQDTTDAVSTIAERVGYASETSFSKTFRRHCGQPPSRFRRATAQPAS